MIAKEYIPYIYKLRTKNERQLKIMLDSLEKEISKIKSEESQKIKKGEK